MCFIGDPKGWVQVKVFGEPDSVYLANLKGMQMEVFGKLQNMLKVAEKYDPSTADAEWCWSAG